MKLSCFAALTTVGLALASVMGAAQNGVTNSTKNSEQIALLHWYSANQTTAFAIASSPFGAAFDGANLWISSLTGNTLTKVRANDGAVLGTFVVGGSPSGVAFDGANVWVANENDSTVSKLRARDGTTLATFSVGQKCGSVALGI